MSQVLYVRSLELPVCNPEGLILYGHSLMALEIKILPLITVVGLAVT